MSRSRAGAIGLVVLLTLIGACGAAEQPARLTPDATAEEDASDAVDASSAVSCDHRDVICRRAEPQCPEMQVAQVVDGCFGACVPIDQCVCPEPEACPHEEKFVCHRHRQRCGPYVN